MVIQKVLGLEKVLSPSTHHLYKVQEVKAMLWYGRARKRKRFSQGPVRHCWVYFLSYRYFITFSWDWKSSIIIRSISFLYIEKWISNNPLKDPSFWLAISPPPSYWSIPTSVIRKQKMMEALQPEGFILNNINSEI